MPFFCASPPVRAAYALYMQAAAELDAFALNSGASRAPEELQGALGCAVGTPTCRTLTRPCTAAIRAKAEEYRLRAQAIAPSVRRSAPARAPRPPRAHAASIAGAGARHGNHGAGGAGWRRAGVAGHAGGARCRRRADDGRRGCAGRCGGSGCARPAHGTLPHGSRLASRLTHRLRRPLRRLAPLRTRRRATTTWATSRAPPASKHSRRWRRPKVRPCEARCRELRGAGALTGVRARRVRQDVRHHRARRRRGARRSCQGC